MAWTDHFPAPQLSVLDPNGKVVITNLFAKAQLRPDQMTKSCESISASVTLLSTTRVDIAVGLVGTPEDWNSSVAVYKDVTQASQSEGYLLDTTPNVTARSISSGLITLAVQGSQGIFNRSSAANFSIEVEQLSVMHFLDSNRFNTVLGLIRANAAYAVVTNPSTGRPNIEFTKVIGDAMPKCDPLLSDLWFAISRL